MEDELVRIDNRDINLQYPNPLLDSELINTKWYEKEGNIEVRVSKMPIYRTVSDRGLWKKYQRSEQSGQPQHFHKAHYLDKNKPVVSRIIFRLIFAKI